MAPLQLKTGLGFKERFALPPGLETETREVHGGWFREGVFSAELEGFEFGNILTHPWVRQLHQCSATSWDYLLPT